MNIYSKNTSAQYVTKLPKHIEMAGNWSISLKEISTPISLVNIKNDTHVYQIKNVKTGKVVVQRSVPSNAYPNEISFICQLNTMISCSYAITFRWASVQNNQHQIKISNGSDTYAF